MITPARQSDAPPRATSLSETASDWYQQDSAEVVHALQVDPTLGLSTETTAERLPKQKSSKGCSTFDVLFMVPVFTTGACFVYSYGYSAYIISQGAGIAEFLLTLVIGVVLNSYASLIGGITGLLIGLGIGVSLTLGKIFLFVITSLLPAKHLQSRIFMVSLLIIGGISASSFTNIVTKSDILSILSHSTITVTRVISIIIGLVTAFGMSLVDFESGKSIQKETDSINGET